jgi:phenylpropionate dioxygenase-like ring-hydroxylating dioxygenase large terminal subunit
MERAEQIAQAKRLLHFLETKTTAVEAEPYRQPIREYICPEQSVRERQRLFSEGPLCLGASAQIRETGDYITDDLTGVPILVARGRDGQARAFLNVCRHRGAKVAAGCGNARSFVCPYHAWNFGLDGSLIGRPEEYGFEGLGRTQHGLTELWCEERDGNIWVCPTPGKTFDVSALLGTRMGAEMAAFDFGNYHHYETKHLTRRMNWKVCVDTFLESYHFPKLHRDSIAPLIHGNLNTADLLDNTVRMLGARRTLPELASQSEADWDVLRHIVGVYVLFPNVVWTWQLDHVEVWHIYPSTRDPIDECTMRVSLYTPEPALTEKARDHWDRNFALLMQTVETEDFEISEQIQQGFHSGAQDHIVFGRNEPCLHYYHRTLTAAVNTDARAAEGIPA